jgi:hypothetical protein
MIDTVKASEEARSNWGYMPPITWAIRLRAQGAALSGFFTSR